MNHHRTPPLPPQNGPDQMNNMPGTNVHPASANNQSPYYSSGTNMCPTSQHPGVTTIVSPVIGGTSRACAGCGMKIVDRFLLYALDRYWHTACLKCACCQATLADIGSSCFIKSGMILCRQDYARLYGNSGACSSCGLSIPANELVMKVQGNVYHLSCFTCVKCSVKLHAGDRFNLVNGNVLCEQDCLKMMKGSVAPSRKTKSRINSTIKV